MTANKSKDETVNYEASARQKPCCGPYIHKHCEINLGGDVFNH